MFGKILIPLDGSSLAECVLPHGISAAKALGAKVIVLQVVEPVETGNQAQTIDPLEWHYKQAESTAYLRQITERFKAVGMPAEQTLLEGEPAERLIEYLRVNNTNLILLSSHGRSGLSRWTISSVVQKILARAHVSFLLIPAYQPSSGELTGLRYRRILVPLDCSKRAECVLPIVSALANHHDSQILLAHVVRKPELPRQAPPSKEDQALADALTERNRHEAGRYLEELRSRLSLKLEIHLLVSDHQYATLQQLALDENVDLVVLSAHGYSGGTHRSYGSLTTSFILYGDRPLLIIQDLPWQSINPSTAELVAREYGHH
jgi:nucleotide-binding universal stress UspA family protein